ncbi:hypothetical protein SAMN05660485_03171 [Blastococcus fimeti]|nr:hypothetical protein SAMN05660485_03171 [Blastococcus fimeti]
MAQHGGGGVAGVEERGVELVEVLGAQPVEAVPAESGDQVLADGGLVALQRPLPHPARGDGGEPVLEPLGDGRCGDGAEGARVALAFQVADLRDHYGPGLAGDVPAVGLAAEGEADGDVAVPPPIGVLVDRRLTVRRACGHPLPLGALPEDQFRRAPGQAAGVLWIHAASGEGCGRDGRAWSRRTYCSTSAWEIRQLRPMCTARSSPLFMSAYTVVRPMRRTRAASSGVRRSRSPAMTSRNGCGSPMSTSPGSVASLLQGCCTTVRERPPEHLLFPSRGAHRAVTAADWRTRAHAPRCCRTPEASVSASGEPR